MSQAQEVLGRTLKWLGAGVLALMVLASLLLLIALLVNAHDEPLAPQALALLAPPANPYLPADNVYVALQGFDAPPAESVIAAGTARIEQRLTRQDAHRLAFKGDVSFIQPLVSSVWDEAPQHEEQIRTLVADNHELLMRYFDLTLLRGYYESARASALTPSAEVPNQVRRLFLAQLALQMRAPSHFERQLGLAELELDIRLWHRVLTGEGTLLWKMLAIAFLQSDYLLLADLIADRNVDLDPREAYAEALVPSFDEGDWDLGRAFAAEFRIQVAILRGAEADTAARTTGWLERSGSRLSDRFLKLNATENLLAKRTRLWMAAAADPGKYYRTVGASAGGPPHDQNAWLLPWSYNPLGRLLAAPATESYRHYPPRAWDEAALQRLVRVGYEIRQRRIRISDLPTFLQAHPQWSTHPADGRPFLWDADTRELRVQTVSQHPSAWRFGIRIWQEAPGG